MGATTAEAYELLCGLVVDPIEGTTWGELATDWQHRDALAIIEGRRAFEVRPRGASKTSDGAAVALALMVTLAPRRSRSYVYAVDADQAAEVLDIITGLVQATPGLSGAVSLTKNVLEVNATGASLRVESSDSGSAFSKRPWLVVTDELTSWPDTANHRRLWAAIVSAMPKRADSRLLVLSMAGSPVHFARKVWDTAAASPDWYTSHIPGPTPWWSAADIEATRELLTPAEFRRYVLAEWTTTDEALSTAEDVAACVRAGSTTLEPVPGRRYVAALDVGTRRDLSALAVGHAEPGPAGRRIVIDRVIYWRPTSAARVDLAEVEQAAQRICKAYRARLLFDRHQAEQLAQNLTRAKVRTQEFVFSQAGANRLARSLFTALRDRVVELPDDEELIRELASVRLVETGPGTVKLVNPAGTHDDLAVVVGMLCAELGQVSGHVSQHAAPDEGMVIPTTPMSPVHGTPHAEPGALKRAVEHLSLRRKGSKSTPGAPASVPPGYRRRADGRLVVPANYRPVDAPSPYDF